jgi:hypothetical protein
MLGRIADAQMMQARMREAGTAMTISQFKKYMPYQRREDLELFIEACGWRIGKFGMNRRCGAVLRRWAGKIVSTSCAICSSWRSICS